MSKDRQTILFKAKLPLRTPRRRSFQICVGDRVEVKGYSNDKKRVHLYDHTWKQRFTAPIEWLNQNLK